MGKLGPFLTLVFLIVLTDSSNAVRRTIKFTGTGNLQSHVACTDEFQELSLTLSCGTKQLLHIEALTISDSVICGNKKNYSCEISQARDFRVFCETEYGGCTHTVRSHHLCPSPNRIHVSFQCIDAKIVHDMCPSEPTTRNHHEPAYYITPRFTHMSYVQCECRVSVEHFIVVKVLYLDLKKSSNGACIDYISFQDGDKYCTSANPQDRPMTQKYFLHTSWKYASDSSITSFVGWLTISASSGSSFHVTCQVLPQSTEKDKGDDATNIGGIIGGVMVATVMLVIFSVITVVIVTRRRRARAQLATANRESVNMQPNPHAFVWPIDSPPGSTETPSLALSSANSPPAYDTLPPQIPGNCADDTSPSPQNSEPL